jgi:hypothetical protein
MDYYPHLEDENGKLIDLRSMREPVEKDKGYTNFYRNLVAILR